MCVPIAKTHTHTIGPVFETYIFLFFGVSRCVDCPGALLAGVHDTNLGGPLTSHKSSGVAPAQSAHQPSNGGLLEQLGAAGVASRSESLSFRIMELALEDTIVFDLDSNTLTLPKVGCKP